MGDSSSSSTIMRRFRSFIALVDGVVTIVVDMLSDTVVGEIVSIALLSSKSRDSFAFICGVVKSATTDGGAVNSDGIAGER